MFGNFIYFITALLIYIIYGIYQPSEVRNFAAIETLFLFISLIVVFAGITWAQFQRIENRLSKDSIHNISHKFSAAVTRQSIMAIVLFSINIYGLNLPDFLKDIPVLSIIPTLQALLFLGLFIFYLSIVWSCAHRSHQLLHDSGQSRSAYVLSNILFSIPILLPWLLLSGIADIIFALPFDLPKQLLSTTQGQVIYLLVFLFVVVLFLPVMIQKIWRCRPLETGYYRNRIESLCRKAGMEYANILYWPIFGSKMMTAGVMGLVKKFRYILVTGPLLDDLEPEEVDAVIAHEIGHIKKKHLVFYLVFFMGFMLVYAPFERLFKLIVFVGLNQTAATSLIFSSAIIIIFLIFFRFIFGYFMRNFERQADTYVYTLFDSAKPLISTLEKIAETSGQPRDTPNWHHFSIKKRVDYLNKCEADKTWITRHDRKINKSIAVYLAGLLLIGGMGYHLNFGETGRKLNKHFFEKLIHRALNETPGDPNLYRMLGNLHYDNRNYAETITAYEQSLALAPDNPEVLNNLAWLYATCDVQRFRNPAKALTLAKRAAHIKESPHILDTLAESYYVNNQFEQAVSAELRALELPVKDRKYYENQLKKFQEAMKKNVFGR